MPKTLSLAVVMDPIAKVKFAKDSTLAMLLAAAGRGWQLTYFEQSDLFLRDGVAYGRGRPLRVISVGAQHWGNQAVKTFSFMSRRPCGRLATNAPWISARSRMYVV